MKTVQIRSGEPLDGSRIWVHVVVTDDGQVISTEHVYADKLDYLPPPDTAPAVPENRILTQFKIDDLEAALRMLRSRIKKLSSEYFTIASTKANLESVITRIERVLA